MEISERIDSDVRIVTIEESQILDEHIAQKIGSRLLQTAGEMNQSHLLLNMRNVKFMASAMIGQLVVLREKCRKANSSLAVCELNDNLCEAIHLMRIDEILPVYSTESEALAAIAGKESAG